MADYPTYYTFDLNRRVYARDGNGRSHGGPIYAEHFRPIKIVGENEREYICEYGTINKRSKKYTVGRDKWEIYTEEEREAAIWRNNHRHRLTRHIERIQDVALLKKIAELAAYEPGEYSQG